METLIDTWGWKRTFGIILFILSFALYGILLMVPLIALSVEVKAALSFMLVVLAEVSFWLSVIILGRGAIEKFRKIEGSVQPNDQQDPDR
jgi:hypothetical protein